ncbi:unnamed protein product [Caenorhabditis sp. 36 PRJEB53466]|nr:unnamed protein product [Caenorhabditis sp. 36 PRJEB53466]
MQSVHTSPNHSRASSSAQHQQQQQQQTPKSSGRHQRPQRHLAQQQQQRKALSMSPQSQMTFANSSLCSSPSARNVPMPPVEWLNQLHVPSSSEPSASRPSSSVSNFSSSSATSSSSSSPIPSSPTMLEVHGGRRLRQHHQKIQEQKEAEQELKGVRVCPLQLIAAVASA